VDRQLARRRGARAGLARGDRELARRPVGGGEQEGRVTIGREVEAGEQCGVVQDIGDGRAQAGVAIVRDERGDQIGMHGRERAGVAGASILKRGCSSHAPITNNSISARIAASYWSSFRRCVPTVEARIKSARSRS